MDSFKEFLFDDRFEIDIPNFDVDERVRIVIYDNKSKSFSLQKEVSRGTKFAGLFSELSSHRDFKYKIQTVVDGRWVDKVKYQRLLGEKVSHDGLKYLFFPSKAGKKLVVVFQAINRNPSYNYVGTLASVDAHRLYIKDDYGSDEATKSSYYLGVNKSFDIHHKVISLIHDVQDVLDIKSDDVIFCGSSKGGFSSIYTSLSLGYGTVVAGGPQIMLGNFLNSKKPDSVNPPIMDYLAGDRSQSSIDWLNSLIPDQLEKCNGAINIFIHVGAGEPHYLKHVKPFAELCSQHSLVKVNLDLGNYSKHSELAEFFPNYLKKMVNEIVK